MKTKIYVIFFIVLGIFSTSSIAQSLNGFTFQGIALDANNTTMASKVLSFRVSIYNSATLQTILYSETFPSVKTTENGVYTFNIGTGTSPSSNFSTINWSSGSKYLYVEMLVGSTYTAIGLPTLIKSVPFAFYAKDAVSTAKIQNVSISTISPVDGQTLVYYDLTNEWKPTNINYTAGAGINITNGVITNTAPSTYKVAILRDIKNREQGGGSVVANIWNVRDLNTIDDPFKIIKTFTNSSFTLVPGIYEIEVEAPFIGTQATYVYLYNKDIDKSVGSSEIYSDSRYFMNVNSKFKVYLNITTEKTYQIGYRCQSVGNANYALGNQNYTTDDQLQNRFTKVTVIKIK